MLILLKVSGSSVTLHSAKKRDSQLPPIGLASCWSCDFSCCVMSGISKPPAATPAESPAPRSHRMSASVLEMLPAKSSIIRLRVSGSSVTLHSTKVMRLTTLSIGLESCCTTCAFSCGVTSDISKPPAATSAESPSPRLHRMSASV